MKLKTMGLAFAALVVALPVGCTSPERSESQKSPDQAAGGYNGADHLRISETPLTLTLFYPFGPNGAPKGDMPVWKATESITNVKMKNVASESITDAKQSLNTMLASAKLPDIIQGGLANTTPLLSQGVYIPLNDLIEKHGPNIKRFLDDYPEAVNAGVGPDGKIYLITGTLGGEPGQTLPSMGFYIRKDWLDKLGLPIPANIEEYKKALYAFREKDPNGNGKKDEVPYFSRSNGIDYLLQLFDAEASWYVGDQSKVYYGKATKEYKAALQELAQWYKAGVIDPEIYTRGSQARQFLLGNNLGGATMDWFASTGSIADEARANVQGLTFAVIAPPADTKGKVKQTYGRAPIHGAAWGISKDSKNPVAAIEYMDFFFSEKGHRLMANGIQDQDYVLENGKPAPTRQAMSSPAGLPNYLRSIGAGYEIGRRGDVNIEIASMNQETAAGFSLYSGSNWIRPQFPNLVFTEEERAIIDENMTNIKAKIDEYEQRCLTGAQEVAATWDSHMAALNDMNLAKVSEAYNKAYARYKTSGAAAPKK